MSVIPRHCDTNYSFISHSNVGVDYVHVNTGEEGGAYFPVRYCQNGCGLCLLGVTAVPSV